MGNLSSEYKVTKEVVIYALYIHSGSVYDAMKYLQNYGIGNNGWSFKEDEFLLSEKLDSLINRSTNEIEQRLEFLESGFEQDE